MPYPDSQYPSILRGYDKRESKRLLEAAPSLLAACRQLRDHLADLIGHVHNDTDSDYDLAYCEDAVELADAAIAKAEGRE
jgi:hypothetical protein